MNAFAILAGTFIATWLVAMVVHRRWYRQTGATFTRCAGVTALGIVVGMLPLMLAMTLDHFAPSLGLTMENYVASSFCGLISAIVVLGRPQLPGLGRLDLPLLADETVQERIASLALAQGVRPLRTMLMANAGGELLNQAFACGLVSPVLIVGNGILHRIDHDERDAILAHELAHHATGSLWALYMVPIVSGCVALVVCASAHVAALMSFHLLLAVGAQRVVSRHFEIRCDLAAARAVGAACAAAAIEKIHAGHLMPVDSRFGKLAFACATHPMPAVRREAIWRAAPGPEQDRIAVDLPRACAARKLARMLATLWVAILVVSAALANEWPMIAACICLLGACVPSAFLRVAIRDVMKLHHKRIAKRATWHWAVAIPGIILVSIGIIAFVSLLQVPDLRQMKWFALFSIVLALLGLVLVIPSLKSLKRRQKLVLRISAGMRAHDFAAVLAIAAEPGVRAQLDRHPDLNHDVALARYLAGNHEEAVSELKRVARAKGALPLAWFTLAQAQLFRSPAAALDAMENAATLLRTDPGIDFLRGRALIALGRLDEAEPALERASAIRLHLPYIDAARAEIALARGDLAGALERARAAVGAAPGAVYPQLVLAEIEMARAEAGVAGFVDRQTLAAICAHALALARENPYAMAADRAQALAMRVEKLNFEPGQSITPSG